MLQTDDRRIFSPGDGQVLAVLSSPSTGLTNADSATANLQIDVFDSEAGRRVEIVDALTFRPLVGLRYELINQHLRVNYDGGFFVNGRFEARVDFRGFGARIGGETTAIWVVDFNGLAVSLQPLSRASSMPHGENKMSERL